MYAFVHIDKTAGSTVKSILRRSFGARHCDVRLPLAKKSCDGRDHRAAIDLADLRRLRRVYRNLIGFAGHNVKAYTELGRQCPEIRFFTMLRDPVGRFRSHFLNRSALYQRSDFDRWAADPLFHNWQTKMIAGEPNAEKAIEVLSTRIGFAGLTERFDESVIMLRQWLQAPGFCPEYRKVNQHITKKGNPVEGAQACSDDLPRYEFGTYADGGIKPRRSKGLRLRRRDRVSATDCRSPRRPGGRARRVSTAAAVGAILGRVGVEPLRARLHLQAVGPLSRRMTHISWQFYVASSARC